jgi:hypothetical protein
VLAGPADEPQAQGLLPYDIRRQLMVRRFQEIDTNKDGVIERVELTAYAVRQFLGTEPTLSLSSPPLGGEEHDDEG